ncbi:MAG: hypothetical protein U1F87_18430 [Kiritimatiellia bacterium]
MSMNAAAGLHRHSSAPEYYWYTQQPAQGAAGGNQQVKVLNSMVTTPYLTA